MLIVGGNQSAAGGYNVDNSLRFDDGSSDYLNRTPGSSGNRKTWTFSTWVKRGNISIGNPMNLFGGEDGASTYSDIMIGTPSGADDTFWFKQETGVIAELRSTMKLRDPSAWYHLVFVYDSTNATADDRMKMYVNGIQLTDFVTRTNVGLNVDSYVNSSGDVNYVGSYQASSKFFDGYLSETVLIDGTALDPTSFGEFDEDSGIWKPISVSGLTFGTNGFYLPFENSAALGQDDSGNGNNFTVNNLTSIDQTTDTPTNNFCTINSVAVNTANIPTMSDGNLTALSTTGSNASLLGTIAVGSGKWYYEAKPISGTGGDRVLKLGWGNPDKSPQNQIQASIIYRSSDGNKYIDNSGSSYGATYTDGDIIGVALDISGGTVTFYKNGVSQGDITISGGLDDGTFYIPFGEVGNTDKVSFNFGNPPFTISSGNSDENGYGNFEYAVPSGYYAICTKNLAEYG